ncbi:hypothetical protein K470DRAFT_264041 [Piedraia hortae CBS 480.64]|uniref:Uncharacterized protein n=1 Tax=Piedraia hortae CBS 480.64 TaxID=1314780 RepID=A0A6A7C0Q0_9PEZI|nr:hypothetical protein K470DRAFT_264041 [Piedraia hortae CBS 480.64]
MEDRAKAGHRFMALDEMSTFLCYNGGKHHNLESMCSSQQFAFESMKALARFVSLFEEKEELKLFMTKIKVKTIMAPSLMNLLEFSRDIRVVVPTEAEAANVLFALAKDHFDPDDARPHQPWVNERVETIEVVASGSVLPEEKAKAYTEELRLRIGQALPRNVTWGF